MTATAEDIGKHAQAVTLQGVVHAAGDIVAYCDVPTVTIADPVKGHVSWRADLTTVTDGLIPLDTRGRWHDPNRARCRWGGMPGPGEGRELCDCPPRPLATDPAVLAERARIVAAIATPDNALLAALIEINDNAKLMRDWVLSIVNDTAES